MMESAAAWAATKTQDLPPRWQARIMGRWRRRRSAHAVGDYIASVHAEAAANAELRELLDKLAAVRLPLGAADSTICDEAARMAGRAAQLAAMYADPGQLHGALVRMAAGHAVKPPTCGQAPAIRRMSDAQWWRRQLRKTHAAQVEDAAIGLGYVNRNADPYCSAEAVIRRAQQNARNAATLEATIAINEDEQSYTLAELAAKGPANKAIRRAELMTRIAGFERIADDLGHVGIFVTLTCPSRMHKWRTTGGHVHENPLYDGTLPDAAQKYLATVWARSRAAFKRAGVAPYGFRIAEPNHDGTPHWHCLFFMAPGHVDNFRAIMLRHALADSPDERGAADHRCDFKAIDKGRGSAAGYIAKYVAKNIDGYRMDKDLIGNDAIETSHRVEAWAATWRIRQFQQIGGAPVGPWRELRRVKALPAGAPAHLRQAWAAVSKTTAIDDLSDAQQQHIKGTQWDEYTRAQGGVACGRRYAIRVETMRPDGLNRYGEPLAPVPLGVSTLETYTPAHMQWMGGKAIRRIVVESARHVWRIMRQAGRAIARVFNGRPAQPAAPWTCVNNCTRGTNDGIGNSTRNDAQTDVRGGESLAIGTYSHQGHGGGLC